ncbi:hypothetical protein QFC21_001358 [Naganishia friedmannii]|uniref:Uncharacterized protein n=1 Tax=Naganishia friedmannii TaxID=89922 RepID=A0ACC2W4U3_9TREE|nr:hypothetical protein QFC21_001358 [Naganishia friedmannii]
MAIKSDAPHKQDSAAPPSYAAAVAQSGASSSQPPPQAVTRTLSLPGDEHSHLAQPARGYHGHDSDARRDAEAQWFPPTSEREVKSRARKRFFMAFLWAFVIYTILGMFIGGTVEDARNSGRHHRHSGRQSHNPQSSIDDDRNSHPTRTWHKVTPTPTVVVAASAVSEATWQAEEEEREVLLLGDIVS